MSKQDDNLVKAALLKRALGYEIEETEIIVSKDGRPAKIKKRKRHIPPNTRAMMEYRRLYGEPPEKI